MGREHFGFDRSWLLPLIGERNLRCRFLRL